MERMSWRRAAGLIVLLVFAGGFGCGGSDDGTPCTATAPPTIRDEYIARDLTLVSTNCAPPIDDVLAQIAAMADECTYSLTQNSNVVSAVDCDNLFYTGCVSDTGEIEVSTLTQGATEECAIALGVTLTANATAATPTTASFDISLGFGGCGGFQNCEGTYTSAWVPVASAVAGAGDQAPSGEASAARALLDRLLGK